MRRLAHLFGNRVEEKLEKKILVIEEGNILREKISLKSNLENSFLANPTQSNPSFPSFLPEALPEQFPFNFLKICEIGFVKSGNENSIGKEIIYCLEVCSTMTMPSKWRVFRSHSQFERLRDDLASIDNVRFKQLPTRSNGASQDQLIQSSNNLELWLSELLKLHLHNSLLEPLSQNRSIRRFLTNQYNCCPESYVIIFSTNSEPEPSSNLTFALSSPGGSKVTVKDFLFVKVIGKGSFGKVSLVQKNNTGAFFAMKVLRKSDIMSSRQLEYILRERRILQSISSPFFAKLHYAFKSSDILFLVLEYAAGGEVLFHLSRCKRFNEPATRFYCAELTCALEYLHEKGIIFRDLKPENILLDWQGHIKLVDFGLAKDNITSSISGGQTYAGTEQYLAPEIICRHGHGKAVDWWGLGIIAFEMLTGLPPWYSDDACDILTHIQSSSLKFPSYVSRKAAAIIQELLQKDPISRLGCGGSEEVKNHVFFMGIDWFLVSCRQVCPPFRPCKDDSDISEAINFEDEFKSLPLDTIDFWDANGCEHSGFHVDSRFESFTLDDDADVMYPTTNLNSPLATVCH